MRPSLGAPLSLGLPGKMGGWALGWNPRAGTLSGCAREQGQEAQPQATLAL